MRQYYSLEFHIDLDEREAEAVRELSPSELDEAKRRQAEELKELISDEVSPDLEITFTKVDNTRLEEIE
jgi:hypothetical protein